MELTNWNDRDDDKVVDYRACKPHAVIDRSTDEHRPTIMDFPDLHKEPAIPNKNRDDAPPPIMPGIW